MKVALLGYGTVGVGVRKMLQNASDLEAGPVLVRAGKEKESFQTSDFSSILSDPSVQIVAEVMGGVEPAYTYGKLALESGKHFVTSNKVLCAAHGLELAAIARKRDRAFLFSAACGGGVPFLANLSAAAGSDRIRSISGILNGTTNYMLDAMQRRDLRYEEALAEAQRLGYAEADPTADVSGLDALRKIMLACAVSFSRLPQSGMDCEGIENLTADDVMDLKSRDLVCRLIARGKPTARSVCAYVEPVLFSRSAPESSVQTNYNLTKYTGENSGTIIFMGQGAGRFPTASAVLRDLSAILTGKREMFPRDCVAVEADDREDCHRYYVRTDSRWANGLPLEELLVNGSVIRAVTSSLSVSEMHARANKIRKQGGELFFAAMEEDNIC